MVRDERTKARDPEIQALRVRSLQLIAEAESIYSQLADHQIEMAGFLRRASDVVDPAKDRQE